MTRLFNFALAVAEVVLVAAVGIALVVAVATTIFFGVAWMLDG